jgi:anti-anti-sigma factor
MAAGSLETTISFAPSSVTIGDTVPRFRTAAAHAMEAHLPLRVDLVDVMFIDSVGLGALLSLAKWVRDHDGECRLRRPPPSVTRLLEATDLHKALGSTIPFADEALVAS